MNESKKFNYNQHCACHKFRVYLLCSTSFLSSPLCAFISLQWIYPAENYSYAKQPGAVKNGRGQAKWNQKDYLALEMAD